MTSTVNTLTLFDVNIVIEALRTYERAYIAHLRDPRTPRPTVEGACFASRDPRVSDFGAALNDKTLATSETILDTAERILIKKYGMSEKRARVLTNDLANCPHIVWETTSNKWSNVRHEALTTTWTHLQTHAPQTLANMDRDGRPHDSRDPGIDLEDLGICTTLKRLANQHPHAEISFATSDIWCGHGASEMASNVTSHIYHHDGGKWADQYVTSMADANKNRAGKRTISVTPKHPAATATGYTR